jgi:hypothetical protein
MRENELYNKLVNITGYNYVVIIDDEKRNYLINDKYIKNIKYPIFKLSSNSKNINPELDMIKDPYIFNYITILEKAQKILSIDSSIPWLCDFININCNMYVYNNRQDIIKYRNNNIKIIDGNILDKLNNFSNLNNYIFKYPIEDLKSYLDDIQF